MYMYAKYEDATPSTFWDIWPKDENADPLTDPLMDI